MRTTRARSRLLAPFHSFGRILLRHSSFQEHNSIEREKTGCGAKHSNRDRSFLVHTDEKSSRNEATSFTWIDSPEREFLAVEKTLAFMIDRQDDQAIVIS